MSIADKLNSLITARNNIRTALTGKGVSAAASHGFEDFADDVDDIFVFNPDEHAFCITAVYGEKIEPDQSECFNFSNIQTDGATVVNTGLYLFSDDFELGFEIEMNFDNLTDTGAGDYRRIFCCESNSSPYPGLTLSRKPGVNNVAVLSLNYNSNNDIEFQLLSTGNTVYVSYDAQSGEIELEANGSTLTDTISVIPSIDGLFTLGGQYWNGGTYEASDRYAKVLINSLTVKPIKREVGYGRDYVYVGSGDTVSGLNNRPDIFEANIPPRTIIGNGAFNGDKLLQYVNLDSIVELKDDAFKGCVNIKKFDFPNLQTITSNSFHRYSDNIIFKTTEIVAPKLTTIPDSTFRCSNTGGFFSLAIFDSPNLQTIGEYAFQKTSLSMDINFPNLTSVGISAFQYTKIQKVINLGVITSTPRDCFSDCPNLTFIRYPETITYISGSWRCNSLDTIIVLATTPPSAGWASIPSKIYVPDESVDDYKGATDWTAYASRIKPLSEYTGTD